MQDITKKIQYIYHNTDGIYYFLANIGVSDHSRRCVLRRYFILLDSYFEMIGYLKNSLFKDGIIDLKVRKSFEEKIASIKSEWDNKYEIIRNKYSAHHQEVEDDLSVIEWWNEIDYSTITYFYEGMSEIRAIIAQHANIWTLIPTDYSEINFSDTCLKETHNGVYHLAHDRLAISKKNTVGMISDNKFQRKCMLVLSIVDFIFIDCALTTKTQSYTTHYKKILFDTAWLLLCCDTFSLIENMYEDGEYGDSLLTLSPNGWKGKPIIENGNSNRDEPFEENLKNLRNKFAAHVDKKEQFASLIRLLNDFDLKRIHEYCVAHMQVFQRACISDIHTKLFAFLDQKIPDNIVDISYTEHRTSDK